MEEEGSYEEKYDEESRTETEAAPTQLEPRNDPVPQ
jgi:hypothetical protein